MHVIAALSALSLYRTLKYGRFMHLVPYIVALIGTVMLMLSDAKDPVLGSLFFVSITGVFHAVVWYDMRRESRTKLKP
jgi:hypothetical protein